MTGLKGKMYVTSELYSNAVRKYCVYTHAVENIVIYVGMCKLSELMQSPDARRNLKWREIMQTPRLIKTELYEICQTENDATELAKNVAMLYRPICNEPQPVVRHSTTVECVQTGEIYESIAECARDIGCHYSAISNHLAGRKGYRSIKNLTFKRI